MIGGRHIIPKSDNVRSKTSRRPFKSQGGIKGDVSDIEKEKEYLEYKYLSVNNEHEHKLSRGIKLIDFLRKHKCRKEAIKYLTEVSNIYVSKLKESDAEDLKINIEELIRLSKKLRASHITIFLEKWME